MKKIAIFPRHPIAFGLMMLALTLALPANAHAANVQEIGDWPELATMEGVDPVAAEALEACVEVLRTAPVVRSADSPPTPVAHPCLTAWEGANARIATTAGRMAPPARQTRVTPTTPVQDRP